MAVEQEEKSVTVAEREMRVVVAPNGQVLVIEPEDATRVSMDVVIGC